MIDFAKKSDIAELSALWKESFGDSDEYINNFMTRRFIPGNTLVYRVQGSVVSQLFLLEGDLRIDSVRYPSMYIYAACTSQSFRGRGIMAALIERAHEIAKDRNVDFICLVPGEEGLFNYYSKCGFVTAFEKKRLSIERKYLRIISDRQAQSVEPNYLLLGDFRNSRITRCDAFLWNGSAVEYAAGENELIGGKCVYNGNPLNGYAFMRDNGNSECHVYECCVSKGAFPALAKLILDESSAENFIFDLPLDFPLSADKTEIIKNAMLMPVSVEAELAAKEINSAYFGLALE